MIFITIGIFILLFLFGRDTENKLRQMDEKLDRIDDKIDSVYDKVDLNQEED